MLPSPRPPPPVTGAETRVLARTAAVLLLVSGVRYGWEARRGPPLPPPAPDDGPVLLEESRLQRDDEARRARPLAPDERIDPNRAEEAELDRLPGVGRVTARALVAARERTGGFRDAEALLAVPGIGPATLARIAPHLDWSRAPPALSARAGPDAPIDLNRATAAELESLPGVGPALARRILEARSRRGRFRAPEELLEVRGIGAVTFERLRGRVRVLR